MMNLGLLVLYCNFTVLSIDQSLTPQHFSGASVLF